MNFIALYRIYEMLGNDVEYAEERLECVTKEFRGDNSCAGELPAELAAAHQSRISKARVAHERAVTALAEFEATDWVAKQE